MKKIILIPILILTLITVLVLSACSQDKKQIIPKGDVKKIERHEKQYVEELLSFTGKIKYPEYIPNLNDQPTYKYEVLARTPDGKLMSDSSIVPTGFSTTTQFTVTNNDAIIETMVANNEKEEVKISETQKGQYYKKINALTWKENDLTYIVRFVSASPLKDEKAELIKVAQKTKAKEQKQKLPFDISKIKIAKDSENMYPQYETEILLSNFDKKDTASVMLNYFNDGYQVKISNEEDKNKAKVLEQVDMTKELKANIFAVNKDFAVSWKDSNITYTVTGISAIKKKEEIITTAKELRNID